MNIIGRQFLTSTNGGLEIFKKYVIHDFELDEQVIVDDIRFMITWNERYNNYAIYIDMLRGSTWSNEYRFNAIWYIKEKFNLNETEVYQKLDREMGLGILLPKSDDEPKQSFDNFLNLELK